MITNGRYYTALTGNEIGNDKYSPELKQKIEEAGQLCLNNLKNEVYSPIMLLGNIQSGKTRAFIGLMSLCFDNDFDMTIILTKCSKALVQQTVSRMATEFDTFRTGNSTVGDVVSQDILELDFKSCTTMTEKEQAALKFAKKYTGKKRIIVVKKQADNVERLNLFIEAIVKKGIYKRLLIVDDEADITSIGYEQRRIQTDLSLRKISGAINYMRKTIHSNIEHVLMQVTATPYALYLQPESFSNESIMPIKPTRTVVLPTGKGYIGGQYYFLDSDDETAPSYHKAKFLPQIVPQDEMSILNGNSKNSGKNSVLNDGRTIKMQNFIYGQSKKDNFKLPSLRKWIFDILAGTALVQLQPRNEDYYVSAVMHMATTKPMHKIEKLIIEQAINELIKTLTSDIDQEDFVFFLKKSYDDLIESCKAYNVIDIPSFDTVYKKVAYLDEDNELCGLIQEVEVKEVNSDSDITRLLNVATGELKLESALTIFVGGQVLDRGITIPNMISFFYGRDPAMQQQDTVMQHCRMFGYRGDVLLSVTRFYTTYKLFSSMQEITIRDNLLRERMLKQKNGEVVYLEAGGKIKACSPQKILASNLHSILPEKRYLPVGFDIDKKKAKKNNAIIEALLNDCNGLSSEAMTNYQKGESEKGKYVLISADEALALIRASYESFIGKADGNCNQIGEMESVFLFSLSEWMQRGENQIALITRRNRELAKMKRNGLIYQNAPDDGNNEGALAKALREHIPVLVMIEQTGINKGWEAPFWWPVYYTPVDMNVGIYADETTKTGVLENNYYTTPVPMIIEDFPVIDNCGISKKLIEELQKETKAIQNYYNESFNIPGSIECTKKRKEMKCAVIVEKNEAQTVAADIPNIIEKIKRRAEKIFEDIIITKKARNTYLTYLDILCNLSLSDKYRESALMAIAGCSAGETEKKALIRLLYEAEELVKMVAETWGLFMPLGNGKCEIHLFYNVISKLCSSYKYSEKMLPMMIKYVLAHEMLHSIHYADVMTESGRWLYKKKDYHKQGAVQETLAEYFALCYVRRNIDQNGAKEVFDFIHEVRKPEAFPDDGGYSGALILEKNEIKTLYGNKSDHYKAIYTNSLKDMIKAFQYIK